MAKDYGKILDKIAKDNASLNENELRLQEAFEKLDSRLNVLQAGVRIEPYIIGKDGPCIGFRRFQDGWHITTKLEGLAGLSSEIPALEADPGTQVVLVNEVGALLDKISKAIADKVKASASSVKEAESLLDALP